MLSQTPFDKQCNNVLEGVARFGYNVMTIYDADNDFHFFCVQKKVYCEHKKGNYRCRNDAH